MAVLDDKIDIMAEVERLRMLAEEARTTAAEMTHVPSRETVLRIADTYDHLANNLEDSFRRSKPKVT